MGDDIKILLEPTGKNEPIGAHDRVAVAEDLNECEAAEERPQRDLE